MLYETFSGIFKHREWRGIHFNVDEVFPDSWLSGANSVKSTFLILQFYFGFLGKITSRFSFNVSKPLVELSKWHKWLNQNFAKRIKNKTENTFQF